MIKQIEQLITDNRLFEALTYLKSELQKSYNLSNGEERKAFNDLKEMQRQISGKILRYVQKELSSNEINPQIVRRGFAWSKENIADIFPDNRIDANRIANSISKLNIHKNININSYEYDSYIFIIEETDITDEFFIKFNIQSSKTVITEKSEQKILTAKTKDGKECYDVPQKLDNNLRWKKLKL